MTILVQPLPRVNVFGGVRAMAILFTRVSLLDQRTGKIIRVRGFLCIAIRRLLCPVTRPKMSNDVYSVVETLEETFVSLPLAFVRLS